MHRLITLGIAAAFVVSGSALAEDTTGKVGAAAGAAAGTAVDATTTGSVAAGEANYGSLISGLRANKSADLSAYSDTSTFNCVTVSSLSGDTDNGASLDGAISSSGDQLATLRGDISSNTELWADIQASCSNVAGLTVDNVLSIQSGADGQFTVYVDDRS